MIFTVGVFAVVGFVAMAAYVDVDVVTQREAEISMSITLRQITTVCCGAKANFESTLVK
jgi:hypothetical protein